MVRISRHVSEFWKAVWLTQFSLYVHKSGPKHLLFTRPSPEMHQINELDKNGIGIAPSPPVLV